MPKNQLKNLRKARKMTLEELGERIGTSKQTVQRYESGAILNIPTDKVEALADALGVTPAALMGWEEGFSYAAFDNLSPIRGRHLPILGDIACGEPIYAEEEHESYAAVSDNIPADFCLRAQGDSMIGARIYDGDVVFIRAQESVENGEIAAVIVDDSATLKRVYFYPDKQKLILSPENPKYEPLVYIGEELSTIKIIGKAVAFQSSIL